MKTSVLAALAATTVLFLPSCDKSSKDLEEKLSRLEKAANDATQRQRELETELAEQQLAAERDAIERERLQIEQQRLAMEDALAADDAAARAELEKREQELARREEKVSGLQEDIEVRQQELTGLEGELKKKESELAGREPLRALPVKQYVSGLPTGDFSNFYEPLGNYGSWFDTNDYGYVFQPAIVRDSSWRPYTRGRWAFTNQGWTWVSDEPFGWACYHYGRWTLLRNVGWVWVPGSEWAPAWVTWRESPGHIGWAPLPPETLAWRGRQWDSSVEVTFGIGSSWFSFVSYENFGNNIRPYCLPVAQNTVIFRNTTNITHYQVTNNRIFVGGPRYQRVCSEIGRTFPVHNLRLDQSPRFDGAGRHLRPRFDGRELAIAAPRMDADWNRALSPGRVRGRLGDVSVDRSRELSPEVVRAFQQQIQEEAREAQGAVERKGGRGVFERERQAALEKARRQEIENVERGRGSLPAVEVSPEPPATVTPVIPEVPNIPSRPGRPGMRDGSTPIQVLPEAPPNPTVDPVLPPGVIPSPEIPEIPPGIMPPDQERERPARPGRNEGGRAPVERPVDPKITIVPEAPATPADTIPEKPALEAAEQARQQQMKEEQLELHKRKEAEALAQREASLNARKEMQAKQEEIRQRQAEQEKVRSEQQEEALKAQQEQMRQQQEELQRQQQEQARKAQEEQALQQQQEMQRQQEEQARKAREEEIRRQQMEEQARQQQEEMQRQEQLRQQQEEARRQQEEVERRQQEEMQRQQQERARQQQEEMQRQQQERARQQQEEMQRQQQDRARQQQEQSGQ